jgi:hypothetical protein
MALRKTHITSGAIFIPKEWLDAQTGAIFMLLYSDAPVVKCLSGQFTKSVNILLQCGL